MRAAACGGGTGEAEPERLVLSKGYHCWRLAMPDASTEGRKSKFLAIFRLLQSETLGSEKTADDYLVFCGKRLLYSIKLYSTANLTQLLC